MQYQVVMPHDPSPSNPMAGKSYHFELNGAIWFGMALCDTQSYPEQVSTCTPDSDSNIVDPAVSPNHPGTAFMELQFYPPGWVAVADLGGGRRGGHLRPHQVVRRDEHVQPAGGPGRRDHAEPYLRGQGGHRDLQVRVRHQERRRPGAGEPARLDAGDVHARPGEGPVHELRRPV